MRGHSAGSITGVSSAVGGGWSTGLMRGHSAGSISGYRLLEVEGGRRDQCVGVEERVAGVAQRNRVQYDGRRWLENRAMMRDGKGPQGRMVGGNQWGRGEPGECLAWEWKVGRRKMFAGVAQHCWVGVVLRLSASVAK